VESCAQCYTHALTVSVPLLVANLLSVAQQYLTTGQLFQFATVFALIQVYMYLSYENFFIR